MHRNRTLEEQIAIDCALLPNSVRDERIAKARRAQPVAKPTTARPMPAATALAQEQARHASSLVAALAQDRARIRAILESPEAVGREKTARVIATSSGIEVDAARRMLSKMGLEGAAAAEELDAFARRAAAHVNPALRKQAA